MVEYITDYSHNLNAVQVKTIKFFIHSFPFFYFHSPIKALPGKIVGFILGISPESDQEVRLTHH